MGLYFAQCGLKSVGIFRFYLVDKPNHAVVSIELLPGTFVSAPFTDNLRLHALISHVRQMNVYTLIKLAIRAVVDARYLLNQAVTSVF